MPKNGYGGGSGGAQMVKVRNAPVRPPSGKKGKVDLWKDWKKESR